MSDPKVDLKIVLKIIEAKNAKTAQKKNVSLDTYITFIKLQGGIIIFFILPDDQATIVHLLILELLFHVEQHI